MNKERNFKRLIYVLSVVIPVVVALLFEIKIEGYNTDILPAIYSSINAVTAILLVFALLAVKKGNIQLHERIIKFCLALSVIFLALYVTRHITSDIVEFGSGLSDENFDEIRVFSYVYYFFLITHIILSVIVIPFVLFAYMRGILKQVEKHKKIVRIAFPLWLYVAITGVVVYFMISPYY